jgi:hypothetical protein
MSVDKFGRYSEIGVKSGYNEKRGGFPLTPDGNYNFEGKVINNVGDPVLPTDAVTVKYMEERTPTVHENHWGFSDKRLSNIRRPLYDGEAVNLATLKSLTICKKDETDTSYDVKKLKLSNVGDCAQDGDAVNKKMLDILVKQWTTDNEKHLERLGAALFRYIHRAAGRAAAADVDSRSYLNWEEIHDSENSKVETLQKEKDVQVNEPTDNDEDYIRGKRI